MKERLGDFISVPVHVHARLGSLHSTSAELKAESEIHDSSFSLEAAFHYSRYFFGENCLLTDTDHPFHVCAANGNLKQTAFDPGNLERTIKTMSDGIASRANIVRERFNGQVLTGVEADIIDDEGRLDVTSEVLSELDIVIASLHYDIWKYSNDGKKVSLQEYVDSLKGAVSNPNVDVLGHPFSELQLYHEGIVDFDLWDPLFDLMVREDVLLEVNLLSFRPGGRFNNEGRKKLLKRARERKVMFCVGLDFHGLDRYGIVDSSVVSDAKDAEDSFQSNLGITHFRVLLSVARVQKELLNLGINSSRIVNSDRQDFLNWLRERN